MKLFLHLRNICWSNFYAQSIWRFLYYVLVLLGLLWIYGLNDGPPPSHFIYTEF
ncbi:teichoic acid D-Ala incorporation-associated protein DltX [Gordoniibacillus kamchatkensis]|uniref:teichoic acid D-Ala incorporation-associated protein DltX n=1 Tax=Gordoniibacillus kamchatkensis TaxID=1590651 RepID=UPI000AE3A642|nr:teichoic acid D-Ala incorporation-associated protein DltX [Paenibacillus sp. VKM B-2647]